VAEPMSARKRIVPHTFTIKAGDVGMGDVLFYDKAIAACEAHAAAAVERERERLASGLEMGREVRAGVRASILEMLEDSERERAEARDAFAVSAAEAERTIARLTSERDEARADFSARNRDANEFAARMEAAESALAAERAARAEAEKDVERLRVLLDAARGAIMTVPECIWSNPTPVGDEGLYRISAFLADIDAALAPRAENPT
jgi:hypothetical protein